MANIRELRAVFSAQTRGITQALRAVRTEVSQLGPASQTAAQSASNNIQNIGGAAQDAAGNVQSLSQAGSGSLGSLGNAADNAAGDINQLGDAAGDASNEINDLGNNNNLNDLTNDAGNAENNLGDLEDQIDDVDDALNDAEDGVHDFGDAAESETQNAEGSFGKLKKALGGIAIAIAGAFAIDKIKDFAWNLAETAGSAQAMKAQFAAVFEGMEDEAADKLGAIASEAGILENRMKESFTKIAAFAKTGGMDTAESLNLADRSMRAVADSAAFYDKSLEETTESLQSFLKGNFENDAALGLSATETTRNAAANDLYGKSFIELSESQKQLTLLQMVEDANKVAGALGQAARESDGWENVVGNMKQSWTDFKAVIGEPVLEVAVKGLKGLTAWVKNLDAEGIKEKIGGAFEFIGNAASFAKDKFDFLYTTTKNFFDGLKGLLKDDGEAGREFLRSIGLDEETVMMIDGWAAKFAEIRWMVRDFIAGVKGLFKDDGSAGRDILASLGLSEDLIMKMDEWAMNLSAFRGNVKNVFDAFKKMFSGSGAGGRNILRDLGFSENFIIQAQAIIEQIKRIGGIIKDVFVLAMPIVKSAVSAVVGFLVAHFKKIFDFWNAEGAQFAEAVMNVFKGIAAVVMFVMPAILAIIKMVWTNIKGVISGALNVIMGLVKVFSGLFTGDFSKMWEGLKQIFFGAIQFIWNFVQLTFYGKLLSGAKTFILSFRAFFASLWQGIVSLFKGNATAAISIIRTAWTTIYNSTKGTLTSVWHFIRDIFLFIKNGISAAASAYTRLLASSWSSIYNSAKVSLQMVWHFIKTIFTNVRNFIAGSASGILTNMRNTWNALKTNTTGAFRDIFNAIKTKFTDIVNLAKGLPQRIGDGIGAMASKVSAGVTKVINKLASTLGKGVNGVIGGVNWVLGKIGSDSKVPLWDVPQYAKGTGAHPGGPAIVGDGKGNNAGRELIEHPDGSTYLSPDTDTLVNLPKGAKVWSAKVTKEIFAGLPHYALGDKVRSAKDWIGDKASHVWGKVKEGGKKVIDTAVDVFDYLKNPSGLLDVALNALGIDKPSGGGFVGEMASGAFKKAMSGAVNFVKGKMADMGGSGQGFGPAFRKTSSYGRRRHPITKKAGEMHWGDDYGAPAGTPIPSQAAGTVTYAGYHNLRGNYVKIKSGNMERIYQHNLRNLVSVGDFVKKGQIVGTVGSTGASTGPHLHYEVKRNGQYIKPNGFADGGIVNEAQLAWIAEGGWAESIISHDPAKRVSQKAIWEQTGKELGFDMNNAETVALLERIADAVENGHSHSIIMNEREVAKALNPQLQKLQKSNDKIKEIYA